MSKRTVISIAVVIILLAVGAAVFLEKKETKEEVPAAPLHALTPQVTDPLAISAMRKKDYPGSAITIEQQLPNGNNFTQYLTSYMSDGLKIYALLTVPIGEKPKNGWPVIIFNHGYIAPRSYQTFPTAGQYASYYPIFSENGYIVFKPDYRGNGNSQGSPEGAYYSPSYATDDLNAIASMKKFPDANPNKIGVWGHSMGGNITLRDLVVDTKDIKAAVIWGGVVGSYTDLLNWHDPVYRPSAYELSLRNRHRADLVQKYGTPQQNPMFWNAIDPVNFVSDITAPVQLHAGEQDEEVPPTFSQHLYDKLKSNGKTAEIYLYPGDNHNISGNFSLAMQRSLDFFNKYVKGGE